MLRSFSLALAAGWLAFAQVQSPTALLDAGALEGLRARHIGPAVMSGRVSAMDGHMEKGRITLYVGAASGGVWKTTNGGITYQPIFDTHNPSIGAIRVDPRVPRTVWVGTGESWVRNSVSAGDGIYRTTDGGSSWSHLGLRATERISAIEVDPKDSNTVYVAAQGSLFKPNEDRGVFKTADGGQTWKRILYIDANTGCASLAVDPSNPKIIFAAMWQHRRQPWSFSSGGPGSGLFRSTDGGETWKKLDQGLPAGPLGRIGVAIAPSQPRTVYALVEAQQGGMFRSEDGGETWTRGNAGANIIVRPFYFSLVVVDPKDPKRVYKPSYLLSVSDDGGRSFDTRGSSTHADHHALWIDPTNSEHLFLGTDGGVFESTDRGSSWRMHGNLPIAQFYHVATDMARPYHVYGGLQDNSTWMGSSRVNLANKHWKNLHGGDGFWAFPDPTDPEYVYAESQGGNLVRVHIRTLTSRAIKPEEGPGEPKFRWNWNTPLHLSSVEPGTLFVGAQYLFRSKDKGNSWERLSPDLTTNDPTRQRQEASGGITVDNSSAESHCTIYTISQSPKRGDVIWVGTDDGHLQLTRNGGRTWSQMAKDLPGLPKGTAVSWVEASPHREATAFACFDGHMLGDDAAHVYRTDDFGVTWTRLDTPHLEGFAHVLKQDPVRPDLLFLGTESGLYISLEGGRNWVRFQGGNFPRVPVRDIVIHPRDHDLVLATHGRGIWIIDDLTPLRAITLEVVDKDLVLLPTRPNPRMEQYRDGWSDGDSEFLGQEPVNGAVIAYWQKKRHLVGDFKVEVLDKEGRVLMESPASKRRGFNFMAWDGTGRPPRVPKGTQMGMAGFIGPRLPEGIYTLRLTRNENVQTGELAILPDPETPFTREDRALRYRSAMELHALLEEMAYRTEQLVDLQTRAKALQGEAKPLGLRFAAALEVERAKLVPVSEAQGIVGEHKLREKVTQLYAQVNAYGGRPSQSQLQRVDALKKEVAEALASLDQTQASHLPALNQGLGKADLPPLSPLTRAAWDQATRR